MAQLAGCCALSRILSAAGTLGGACDGAAADAVIAAMSAQTGDSTLHMHGCMVLSHIFDEERHADDAWVRRRGAALHVLTAMLHAHQHDAEVLVYGCGALSQLVRMQKNQRDASIGGVIEALVAALRACPAAADVQCAGLTALGSVCINAHDNQLAAAAAGALEVTISSLRTHTSNDRVRTAGCCTLNALIADVPQSQARVGELGGMEVLVAALRVCAAPLPAERVEHFQSWYRSMVWLLHDHPINTHKAVAAGCMELLVAHTCTPGADASMFGLACRVFGQLLGCTGHAARAVTAGALEALEARRAEDLDIEPIRLRLIRDVAACGAAPRRRAVRHRRMQALRGCTQQRHHVRAAGLRHVPRRVLLRRGAPARGLGPPQGRVRRTARRRHASYRRRQLSEVAHPMRQRRREKGRINDASPSALAKAHKKSHRIARSGLHLRYTHTRRSPSSGAFSRRAPFLTDTRQPACGCRRVCRARGHASRGRF
jgi:hypothetical protein